VVKWFYWPIEAAKHKTLMSRSVEAPGSQTESSHQQTVQKSAQNELKPTKKKMREMFAPIASNHNRTIELVLSSNDVIVTRIEVIKERAGLQVREKKKPTEQRHGAHSTL